MLNKCSVNEGAHEYVMALLPDLNNVCMLFFIDRTDHMLIFVTYVNLIPAWKRCLLILPLPSLLPPTEALAGLSSSVGPHCLLPGPLDDFCSCHLLSFPPKCHPHKAFINLQIFTLWGRQAQACLEYFLTISKGCKGGALGVWSFGGLGCLV